MRLLLLLLPLLFSCEHVPGPSVRQADLDSWIGIPVEELVTHPIYSVMPLEKTELPDGKVLMNYRNTLPEIRGANCKTKNDKTKCVETATAPRGCLNQFIIKAGVIERAMAQPFGNVRCFTDCRYRPASRSCAPGE